MCGGLWHKKYVADIKKCHPCIRCEIVFLSDTIYQAYPRAVAHPKAGGAIPRGCWLGCEDSVYPYMVGGGFLHLGGYFAVGWCMAHGNCLITQELYVPYASECFDSALYHVITPSSNLPPFTCFFFVSFVLFHSSYT